MSETGHEAPTFSWQDAYNRVRASQGLEAAVQFAQDLGANRAKQIIDHIGIDTNTQGVKEEYFRPGETKPHAAMVESQVISRPIPLSDFALARMVMIPPAHVRIVAQKIGLYEYEEPVAQERRRLSFKKESEEEQPRVLKPSPVSSEGTLYVAHLHGPAEGADGSEMSRARWGSNIRLTELGFKASDMNEFQMHALREFLDDTETICHDLDLPDLVQ